MTRYIWGLDPASKSDAYGIVVHELRLEASLPKLRGINKISETSFDKIYDYLSKDMMRRFPPTYIVIDYTNEKTFSDLLVKKYGKGVVELVNFTNANKLMLKEDGLSILRQGYKFPDPRKVGERRSKAGQLIEELITQLQQEQLMATETDKPTFDHPRGQHNDLAIAWELSIHGCIRFMNEPGGPPLILSTTAYSGEWDRLQAMSDRDRLAAIAASDETAAKFQENITKRLKNLGIGTAITDVDIGWPK